MTVSGLLCWQHLHVVGFWKQFSRRALKLFDKPERIHAIVVCWPGKEASAHSIAAAIVNSVDRLTVLYKNDTGIDETGAGEWVRFPNEWYYGRQFQHCLNQCDGDAMLQIQADAAFDNWPLLVERFRWALAKVPETGIWTPNLYHTWYTPNLTEICKILGDELSSVIVSDGVVWGLRRPVIDRMLALDYSRTSIGWGIAEAAAAISNRDGRIVVMDNTLLVDHPRGSFYDRSEALTQSNAFVAQLSLPEQSYVHWINVTCVARNHRSVLRFLMPGYWHKKLRQWRPGTGKAHVAATSGLRAAGERPRQSGESGLIRAEPVADTANLRAPLEGVNGLRTALSSAGQ